MMTSKLRNTSGLVRADRWMLDDENINRDKNLPFSESKMSCKALSLTTSRTDFDFSLRCMLRIRPLTTTDNDKLKERSSGTGRVGASTHEMDTEILRVEQSHQHNSLSNVNSKYESTSMTAVHSDTSSTTVRLMPPPCSLDHTGPAGAPQQRSKAYHQSTSSTSNDGDSYHFDAVFGPHATQQDLYEGIVGVDKTLIQSVMDALLVDNSIPPSTPILTNHLLISLGVSNSGKTHSVFGPTFDRNRDQSLPMSDDGLVKRILHDLFTMGSSRIKSFHSLEKNVSSRTRRSAIPMRMDFAVYISMVYVYNDQVYDMLSHYDESSTQKQQQQQIKSSKISQKQDMSQLRITQHPETKDFITSPHGITSSSMVDACAVISHGLQQGCNAPTLLNDDSSRGHTLITIRPVVMLDSKIIQQGGAISVLDMAGIERTSQLGILNKLSTSSSDMKTSISINASISALLQCLRALKVKSCQKEQLHDEKVQHDVDENQSVSISPPPPIRQYREEGGKEDMMKMNDKSTSLLSVSPLKENQNTDHFLSPKTLLRRRFAQSPALVKQDENQGKNSTIAKQVFKHSSHEEKLKTENKTHQKSVIPFRDNKLTMLLQPLLSGKGSSFMSGDIPTLKPSLSDTTQVQTTVSLLAFAYPGVKDYYEKKYLLGEVSSLVGLSWSNKYSTTNNNKRNDKTISNATTIERESVVQENAIKNVKRLRNNEAAKEKDITDPIVSSESSLRIKELEVENIALRDENKKLKKTIDELLRNNRTHENDDVRDADFLESRSARRRQQTLLQSPLRDHMNTVEQHRMIETGMVRQGPVVGQVPFPLSADKGRKRSRVTDAITSEDDTQLWKYLGGIQR